MRRIVLLSMLPLFLLFVVPPLQAQSEVGEVSFANSGSPEAQEPFLRGLALLHNFEYDDAAEQLRRAQAADPDFAMAYWGEAMTYTHPIWFQQDLDKARAVLGRLGGTPEARLAKAKTERERDYLRAVEALYGEGTKEERDFRFSDAMGQVHERYPDDVDATAFYALSILGTAHQGRDFAIYMRAAALLEEVFPTHPRHPGVLHYLIHSYDDPVHAPLGMRAARLYGGVAPNAGHALHMTSHIFVALGLWDDVIAANVKAMKVVNEHRAAKGKPEKTCGHYVSWLHYSYLQEKRLDDAKGELDACRPMAQKEANGGEGTEGDPSLVRDYAEMRIFHWMETGRWEASEALTLPAGRLAEPKFLQAYGEALVAAKGMVDRAALRAALAQLRERQKEVLAEIEAKKGTVAFDAAAADIVVRQVEALEKIREGKTEEGIAGLRKVAESESARPFEFGPPAIQKPSWELLGDELLALGRSSEAAKAYQAALSRAPGRTHSLQGLRQAQLGGGKTETKAARPAEPHVHQH